MLFLLMGLVLLGFKLLEWGPVAAWSWMWVLAPFGLAVVWWFWTDHSGYAKRKQFEKMEQRKKDRINKSRREMGLPPVKR